MAVSQAQIVDLLYKQAFGVTKTDTAQNKSPSNESIPSPALNRGDTAWTQADAIPNPAAAVANVVQAYVGATAVETIADNTTVPIGGIYPTWETQLTNWIPQEFGATYVVQVWVDSSGVANPTVTGTQIFADGSGGTGQYYYNYESGVLNFIGETIPAALTAGKVLYIVGYRYIGLTGVTNLPSGTDIGNLQITGSNIAGTDANANVYLNPNGSGQVVVSGNITASYLFGNGSQLSGIDTSGVSNGTSNLSIPVANGNVNVTADGNTVLVVTTNGANVVGYLDVNGNITSLNANLGNLATANFVNVSSNVNVTGTMQAGNVRTDNLLYANGNPWDLQEAAGSNTQIQYNDGSNNFGASANFTFDYATQTLNVTGTANISGNLNGNVGSFSGNVSALNANLGNLATATFANFAETTTSNLTVNLAISGNNANFTGNVEVGNLSTTGSGGNITMSGGDLTGANVISANTANISGNVNSNNVVATNLLKGANAQVTSLTSGRVTFAGADSILSDSANLTFDTGTNTFATFNANIAGNFTASTANITGNLYAGNANITQFLETQYANVSANLITGNANLGNYAIVSFLEVTSNLQSNNANVLGTILANVANINGTITSGNANLGNLITANFANISGNLLVANANISDVLTANTANIVTLLTANTANITTLLTTANANVTDTLIANIANISTLNANSFSVSGNISAGNANLGNLVTANYFTGVLVNGTSNVTVANNGNIDLTAGGNTTLVLTPTGANITGYGNFSSNLTALNANLGNLVEANHFTASGNVTANIVSANYLYGILANGTSNIQIFQDSNIAFSANGFANIIVVSELGANVTGYIDANGNVNAGALYSTTLTSKTGALDIYSEQAGNTSINLHAFGTGTVDVGNVRITSLATPTGDFDAATKEYVDAVAQGLNIKASVYVGTAAALPAYTYNNGTAGVGATITASANGALVVDGETISTLGTRVLVKNETAGNAPYNGIYTLTTAGDGSTAFVLTRSLDMNVAAEFDGSFTFISTGATLADTGWVQTAPITVVGTTPVVWTQFSGGGQYSAANGIALNGTLFTANVDNITTAIDGGNIVVKANAAFTTPNIGAATGTSIDLTGNVLAANVNANGEVFSNTLLVTNLANVGSLSVIGNSTTNNLSVTNEFTANAGNVSGNLSVGNLTVNGNSSLSGNFTANNITANNAISSNIANITNGLIAGNVTSNALTATRLTFAGTSGILTDSANLTFATISDTLSTVNADLTGNVVAANLTSNALTATHVTYAGANGLLAGNSQFTYAAIGDLLTVGNANVGANINAGTLVNSPNVTVTSLTAGRITFADTNGLLVDNANLLYDSFWDRITTGQGNFTANLIAANLTSNNLSNGRVTFSNTGGQLVDASSFTYDVVVDLLAVGNANIGAYANIATLLTTPNAQVTSLTSGQVTFAGTGGVLQDSSNLTFSTDTLTAYNSNVTANLNVGTNISATGNVTGGNITTAGTANIGTLSMVGTSNLGPIGNVTITGGTNGQVITTNGAGGLSFVSISTSSISNGNSNVSIPNANGNIEFSVAGNANVVIFTGTGANVNGYLSVSGNTTGANLITTGVVQSNTANISNFVTLGNTNIQWGTATTTAITAGQVIASVAVSGITGVEFLVKGVDAAGGKYSIATVQTVTDGTTVADYATFGTVLVGGLPTGTLSVALNGSNIELQVTPASTNSTVWTTQFRTI